MLDLEEKILRSINLQKDFFGLSAGSHILQKVEKAWKPAIIIGYKEHDQGVQLWTAEEERNREIKYVCWGLVKKPEIKIVRRSMPKELTIKNLIGSLREFSREANKIGIKRILARSSDIDISQ